MRRRVRKETWLFLKLLLLVIIAPLAVSAQQRVSGIVKDAEGRPLGGVNVSVVGSSIMSSTDDKGKFNLSVRDLQQTLKLSYLGMNELVVPLNGQSDLEIDMESASSALDEIVVIGYGEQSRATLTTAVSKLDNKVLNTVPQSNVANALQGTISGVRVQQPSGQPGSNPIIIVRGGTSINNPDGAAPLYLVDGVIKPNLANINQDEIESIQVLKDAASTSIYGARGSNGVVLVTTKSGKSGKSRVVYSADRTISKVGHYYEFLSGQDWIYFMRKGIEANSRKNPAILSQLTQANGFGTGNDLTKNTFFTTQYLSDDNAHKLKEGWKSMPDPIDPTKTIIFNDYDYRDVIFRTANTDNHSLSISGGNEKAKYSMVLGYQDAEGVAVYSDYNRYSANISGELSVNDKLNVYGRLMYAHSSSYGLPVALDVAFRRISAPTTKLYFEDGTMSQGSSLHMGANPHYPNSVQDRKVGTDNTTIIAGADYEILPGLNFRPQISLFMRHYNSRSFNKAYYEGAALVTSRNAYSDFWKEAQPQLDAVLSYGKSVGSHNVDVQAGFSYYYHNNFSISASGRDAATDLIPTLNASAVPVSVSGSESEHFLLGYFGRANYNYDRRYLLSLSARYDGASNLGDDHKWGVFPGVSLGWNIHEETFFKESSLSNYLTTKIRASYGVNGNISGLGRYQAQGSYASGAPYNSQGSIQNTILANHDLRWERSSTLNLGLDVGVFNQRVNFIVDFYRRVTDDLLASMTLPPSSGFSSITTNLASLENKGFDVEISTDVLPSSSKVRWSVSANTSFVKNEILALPDNGVENNRIGGVYVWDEASKDYAWKGGLQEGGTMGDYYAYRQLSVYRTDEEAQAGPIDMIVPSADKTKYGGDVNWYDADGNNIIDGRDLVHVGNMYPKFSGGLSSTVGFHNFNLYVRMDYQIGHTIFNEARMWFLGNAQGGNHMITDLSRSWQNQGDETDIPRFYWADQGQSNLFRGSSLFYEKGDYLALREVTLSYNIPSKVFRNKIDGIGIHVSGHNLHYFTKYKGPSPEAGGTDAFRYPMPRNFVVGAKLRF